MVNLGYDYSFKFLLVGNSLVGKSSLIERYVFNKYSPSMNEPPLANKVIKRLTIDSLHVKLELSETSEFTSQISKNVNAVFFCFDITSKKSFNDIINFLNNLKKHRSALKFLVATKNDLSDRQEVTKEEAEQIAGAFSLQFFSVSACHGNVETPFLKAANYLIQCETIREIPIAIPTSPIYEFKVVLNGDADVGKSSLINRFIKGEFFQNIVGTTEGELHTKIVPVGGDNVKLNIWDTAGSERFRAVTNNYYRKADAVLVVYNCTNRSSFNNIDKWLSKIDEVLEPNVFKYLVGTKCDLKNGRAVTTSDGQVFAGVHNMNFIETSAISGENVNELFTNMAKILTEKSTLMKKKNPPKSKKQNKRKKGSCCN